MVFANFSARKKIRPVSRHRSMAIDAPVYLTPNTSYTVTATPSGSNHNVTIQAAAGFATSCNGTLYVNIPPSFTTRRSSDLDLAFKRSTAEQLNRQGAMTPAGRNQNFLGVRRTDKIVSCSSS